MTMTGTYQGTLFGEGAQRVIGWNPQIADILANTPIANGESDSDYNRRICAVLITGMPQLLEIAEAVIDPMIETSPKDVISLISAWMSSKDYPAPDTIPRAIREVKAGLKQDFRSSDRPLSLNELLNRLQAKRKDERYYHEESEPRVHRALQTAYPNQDWQANKEITYRGHPFKPDFTEPTAKITIEIDSYSFHSEVDRFVFDRQKQRWATLMGYRHLMYPMSQISARNGMARLIEDVGILLSQPIRDACDA